MCENVVKFGLIQSSVCSVPVQAAVCFGKEEDAEKLKVMKNIDVKGLTVAVAREKVLGVFCLFVSVSGK